MEGKKNKEVDRSRTKHITSVSLTRENQTIKKILDKHKYYGWFSKFVNDCFKKTYGSDENLMKSIYKQLLIDNQQKIDDLEENIKQYHNKINRLEKRK